MEDFDETRFPKARLDLIKRFPFWGQLSMYLEPIEVPDLDPPTTAVTPTSKFLYHPEHVEKLSHQDLMFEIAHELGHLFTRTLERRPPGADMSLWNSASDIVIDSMLRGTDLPPSWISLEAVPEKTVEKYENMTTMEVYLDLLQKKKPGDKSGKDGATGDTRQCTGGCKLDKQDPEDTAEWKKRVVAAATAVKNRGTLPGVVQKMILELLEPKIHWTEYLRVKTQECMKRRWSWRVPSRRAMGMTCFDKKEEHDFDEIIMPGRSPDLPTATVAIDTSGSVSQKELINFLSESAEILRMTGGKMRVILFDAKVYYDEEVENFTEDCLNWQRGGTDFQAVFDHIEDSTKKKPQLLIFFTDLYAPYPAEDPAYPVVWGLTPDHNEEPVPFGETVVVED